jgi:hypothetical protein
MITELPDAPRRKPEFPVYREWLQAHGELEITNAKKTTEKDIRDFASKVANVEDSGLVDAVRAIVKQAEVEIKTKPALLVSLPYYLKWRGNSVWRRTTPSLSRRRSRKPSSPRAKKGRYGLFLVRECLKCKTIRKKDETSQKATAAVFRVPAYGEPGKTKSRGKRSVHDKKAEGVQGTQGGKCTCVNNGKRCRFCSNRLCPGHGDKAGYTNKLKADCTDCRKQRWMRRSKSKNANGEPTTTLEHRKALSSTYEPIRAGVFFTDESLIKDVKGHLLAMYAQKYDNPRNETGAPTQGATGGLAVTPAKNSTATITPSPGAYTTQGPPSSNETTSSPNVDLAARTSDELGQQDTPARSPSGSALDVPKIRLDRPLRVSPRTTSNGSFGWRMV